MAKKNNVKDKAVDTENPIVEETVNETIETLAQAPEEMREEVEMEEIKPQEIIKEEVEIENKSIEKPMNTRRILRHWNGMTF